MHHEVEPVDRPDELRKITRLEFLRESHAHRRLGFERAEIEEILLELGLDILPGRDLKADRSDKLTVSLWVGRDPRVVSDFLPNSLELA